MEPTIETGFWAWAYANNKTPTIGKYLKDRRLLLSNELMEPGDEIGRGVHLIRKGGFRSSRYEWRYLLKAEIGQPAGNVYPVRRKLRPA